MGELLLYKVDPDYLRFLHSLEPKVSMKFNNRPFVGVVTMINEINYLIPLTSQTTSAREKAGKKKRSAFVTTFIRDSNGEEIANLLHNNMIPVQMDLIHPACTIGSNLADFPKSPHCCHKNDIIVEIWEGFSANMKKSFPDLQCFYLKSY